jgi:hypothetical protein
VTLPAKPPESAKEVACVLSEGECVRGIEVLEINALSGTVKFRNNLVVQMLKLRNKTPMPGAAGSVE